MRRLEIDMNLSLVLVPTLSLALFLPISELFFFVSWFNQQLKIYNLSAAGRHHFIPNNFLRSPMLEPCHLMSQAHTVAGGWSARLVGEPPSGGGVRVGYRGYSPPTESIWCGRTIPPNKIWVLLPEKVMGVP